VYDAIIPWFACLLIQGADACSPTPAHSYGKIAWYGFHLAFSTEGLILALVWGTQKDLPLLWLRVCKNRTTTDHLGHFSSLPRKIISRLTKTSQTLSRSDVEIAESPPK